jgi:hypothetical protein
LNLMNKSFTEWFSSIGSIVAVAAPKGLCPVCIAASGGALASLGLGFLAAEKSIRLILATTLTIGIVGFILSARRHRRWWTLALGVLGAALLFVGRLLLVDLVLYGGMVLLVGATVADLWARKHPWTPLVQIRFR